jgi:hypothetical protein
MNCQAVIEQLPCVCGYKGSIYDRLGDEDGINGTDSAIDALSYKDLKAMNED